TCALPILHVFVALAVLAPGNICMREFIDEHDGGAWRENGIYIHFFKNRAFVFDFLERDALQLLGQLFNPLTPVCFHYADDHVFAAAAPPQGFAEHAERFSYAGSVAQKKLKDAAGFLWRRDSFQRSEERRVGKECRDRGAGVQLEEDVC